jgi:hypothetical protein
VQSPCQFKEERWAVGIRLKLAGGTAEQIDRLNAAIDPDGNPPDGLIFHASGPVDGGWGVLDSGKSGVSGSQKLIASR